MSEKPVARPQRNGAPTGECLACGESIRARLRVCNQCGVPLSSYGASPERERDIRKIGDVAPGGFVREYRLVRHLGESCGLDGFLAFRENGDEERLAVVIRIRRLLSPPPRRRAEKTASAVKASGAPAIVSADTIRLVPDEHGVDRLHAEYEFLAGEELPAFPRVLDYFEEGDVAALVESAPPGAPLAHAWNQPDVVESQRAAWLLQILEVLIALHARGFVFPSLQPGRFIVGLDGKVHVRDVAGIAKLPLVALDRSWNTLYCAPELRAEPRKADLRSDAYAFGALVYSLYLGRPLADADFLQHGVPRPFAQYFPDAPPTLVRLLGRTFVAELAVRFPASRPQVEDPSGFADILDAVEEHARVADGVRYDIAGWSGIGMVRDNNEDCFSIVARCSGGADFRRDLALVCVADGMGGMESGEVASAMAVAAVTDYLRDRGLNSAAMMQMGPKHPFADLRRAAQTLEESVHEANRRVFAAAGQDAGRGAMGCTLEAVLLAGRNALVCHVGDSRVYHRHHEGIRQVTVDQTLVHRLVEQGRLTPEQAATHPYRSAVVQAIGAQAVVEPAHYRVPLDVGDWLVVCSDGITAHMSGSEINEILAASPNAESASRRLVNLALVRGGADNGTAVVIRAR
jgi:protein phosphatase